MKEIEEIEVNLDINQIDFNHVVQPIMNLTKMEVHGYEFLLRSQPCTDPEALFKYAEKQNQLTNLDSKSIVKVLNTVRGQSLSLDNYHVFINIFSATLVDSSFQKQLVQLIANLKIDPKAIVLEISEFQNGINLTEIRENTIKLKEMGFIIALDDIGKGESTIRALLEIEPDIAKVDRYYAKDLSISAKKQKVIQHLLELFKNDITMVLEGFEEKADLQTAIDLGVPFGQGFYLGKPQAFSHYIR